MSKQELLQKYHGGNWRLSVDLTEAIAATTRARTQADGPGLERAVARIAVEMERQSKASFSPKRDPRTGRSWAAPADITVQDPRFRELLVRTSEMRAALTGAHRVGPSIGTARLTILGAGDVVRRAMVHMYGVKRRERRSNRSSRRRPGALMQARQFTGFAPGTIREVMDRLIEDMGFGP